VWFGDQARVGQKNKSTRRWAKRGARPCAPHDQRTASTYIFGAICPKEGKAAGLILPWCNLEMMALFLAELSRKVAPGRHAGNIDVKELTLGSSLFVPVFHDGGLIFTGDSHALQGDGEVNITALETAMKEVRIQVILHKSAGYTWPAIETSNHWIMLGMHESLNEALRISLRNTIGFLVRQAKLSRDEAYSLASLAVDFRVSQLVDVQNGIHAMIPKSMFAPDFRRTMSPV